ncbi:MAG: ribonuclease H-like YkuK family protein, partial [bacterium]|nr:ribonuclease H-like YkuK family protein [bacterium]
GPTRDMIREITGLIRGNGFEPVIKPDSFAASSVADRFS